METTLKQDAKAGIGRLVWVKRKPAGRQILAVPGLSPPKFTDFGKYTAPGGNSDK
jgi:hypothetical protein